MGLSPKHYANRPKLDLEDLNQVLNANFNEPGDTATIDADKYALSTEELIADGTEAGYTVEKSSENMLKFS